MILTWKRLKARELAKKRAEDLAAIVRAGIEKPEEARVPMSTSLDGQTVTGKDDSPKLVVRQTQMFSWLEQDFQSMLRPGQVEPRAFLSTVRFETESDSYIRFAGNDFMKTVFEDIPNNGVGVASDELRQKYYIVEVKERVPDAQLDQEALLQRFLSEGKQFNFQTSPCSANPSEQSLVRFSSNGEIGLAKVRH